LLIGLGILVAFLIFWKLAKVGKVEDKFVDFTSIALVVAVAVGFFFAMVFQSLYNWIAARQVDPNAVFQLDTGMTFLGGLIGGVACYIPIYFIFRKKFQGRFLDIISILPISLTLAHGFGRFGCFSAGCCYGAEATGPLAFLGIEFVTTPGVKVWPTQLFEAIFLLVLALIMLILYVKKRFPHNMAVYLISYGVFRFLIEYIRGDERGALVAGVSPSQFWSILMVVLGIALLFLMAPMFKKRKAYLAEHPIVEDTVTKKVKKETSIESSNSTGVDAAEDGFKLDEKCSAVDTLEKHLPDEYELHESVKNPSEPTPVEPQTQEVTFDQVASEYRPNVLGKIGENVAEDGFKLDYKSSALDSIEKHLPEEYEVRECATCTSTEEALAVMEEASKTEEAKESAPVKEKPVKKPSVSKAKTSEGEKPVPAKATNTKAATAKTTSTKSATKPAEVKAATSTKAPSTKPSSAKPSTAKSTAATKTTTSKSTATQKAAATAKSAVKAPAESKPATPKKSTAPKKKSNPHAPKKD
jgi:phosphatidylglycerol:prolipoprotein diacylglycerol transferase